MAAEASVPSNPDAIPGQAASTNDDTPSKSEFHPAGALLPPPPSPSFFASRFAKLPTSTEPNRELESAIADPSEPHEQASTAVPSASLAGADISPLPREKLVG